MFLLLNSYWHYFLQNLNIYARLGYIVLIPNTKYIMPWKKTFWVWTFEKQWIANELKWEQQWNPKVSECEKWIICNQTIQRKEILNSELQKLSYNDFENSINRSFSDFKKWFESTLNIDIHMFNGFPEFISILTSIRSLEEMKIILMLIGQFSAQQVNNLPLTLGSAFHQIMYSINYFNAKEAGKMLWTFTTTFVHAIPAAKIGQFVIQLKRALNR